MFSGSLLSSCSFIPSVYLTKRKDDTFWNRPLVVFISIFALFVVNAVFLIKTQLLNAVYMYLGFFLLFILGIFFLIEAKKYSESRTY